MNKSELKERLERENVKQSAYSLEGGLPSEAFVLNQNGNQWEVYYSERGNKSGLKIFDSENDACDEFYREMETYVF